MKLCLVCLLMNLVPIGVLRANETAYPPELFKERRTRLMEGMDSGFIVLFSETESAPGMRFRQDNDFFYLTGINEKNAILVMIPQSSECFLFLIRQTPREAMIEGKNYLHDPELAAKQTGTTEVLPVNYFDEFIAQSTKKYGPVFHLRLMPGDALDADRGETGIFSARTLRNPYNSWLTPDQYRINLLKQRYP